MVIFLDIDGVLNQLQSYYLDDNCISNLKQLCNKLNAKVVLTSSWRLGYNRNYDLCSKQIQSLLDKFNNYGIEVVGRTKSLNNRSLEVETYIKDYNVWKYIILDDDISEFQYKLDNLFIINYKTGLTNKDVKRIIKAVK